MNTTKVTIYEQAGKLPALDDSNFFHSRQLMEFCKQTPRHKPLMAVATDGDGKVLGHLLCIVRFRLSWFPPYLYTHARIYGNNHCEAYIFGQLMEALTERLQNRALYIEVSNLSEKMFGYRELRKLHYFPVRWMSVHNSLHSKTPEERISDRMLKRINRAIKHGVTTKTVETEEEFKAFMKLLRHHHWLKPRRYVPTDHFFRSMMDKNRCTLFISQYNHHVLGCSCLVYAEGDAYLWYSASRRKSFATLHPNAVTYWNTIKYAYDKGCQHIRFMDVGLPFRRNIYRDFILRFGGKEVSTFRWFRISLRWVNKLASWLWRE